jgi:large subunit ribosomal protein L19
MKVTVSDKYAVGKVNEFVGICIERGGCGLRAWFTLRNVVDHQGLHLKLKITYNLQVVPNRNHFVLTGVEIRYEMYNPILQSIQVLKLEKRLDEHLRYLRDCPLEYSTFPIDMQPELRSPDALVPINTTMVGFTKSG